MVTYQLVVPHTLVLGYGSFVFMCLFFAWRHGSGSRDGRLVDDVTLILGDQTRLARSVEITRHHAPDHVIALLS